MLIEGTRFLLDMLGRSRPELAQCLSHVESPVAFRAGLRAALPNVDEHEDLIVSLLESTAVAWSLETYRVLPVLRPYVTRDGSARAPGPLDQWGTPDARGYFRDDNSMLKGLVRGLVISRGADRLGKRGPGWTACHAWRGLPGGSRASSSPWLNSFVPIITWVPTAIAPYTDVEGSRAQSVLKALGESFRGAPVHPGLTSYAESSWAHLPASALAEPELHFEHSPSFVRRRVVSIRKVAAALDAVATGTAVSGKVLGTRYTLALPSVDRDVASLLAHRLVEYAVAVENAAWDNSWPGT